MPLQGDSTAVLSWLPALAAGEIGFYHLDAEGNLQDRVGSAEEVDFVVAEGALAVQCSSDRKALSVRSECDGSWFVVTFAIADAAVLEPFLGGIFDVMMEKEQIELDMESMQSSSLALLEEVSMVGEMLPELPMGDTDTEVAEIGMSALLVASSVERMIYVRVDESQGLAEVAVQVCGGEDGLVPGVTPFDGDAFINDGDNLVWRAIRAPGAILEAVPTGGMLGKPGSPESYAKRQVIAVPVRYGTVDKPVSLGVLLMMDKRANAYSSSTQLGSQETKLASSVASMLGSVLGTRKVTALGNEMRMAQSLQQQILPKRSPRLDGFDLAGHCTTSGAVGGDYYDFLPLPDGRTMVVVADVSGHNLASGMIMVSARTTLRLLSKQLESPAAVFDELAASLFEDLTQTERFITAAAVGLRPGSREIEIVNAGHNPTMVYRAATGEIEEIPGEDTVLGFLPAPEHAVHRLEMRPGDVVLLYTDGVTEAVDANGVMFEEERLRAVLRGAADGTSEEILSAVFRAVADFADKNDKGDDVSAVVIKAATGETKG